MKKRVLFFATIIAALLATAEASAEARSSEREKQRSSESVEARFSKEYGRYSSRGDKNHSITILGIDEWHRWSDLPPERYRGYLGEFEIGFAGLRKAPMAYSLYPDDEHGFMDLNTARSYHITVNIGDLSFALNRAHTLGMTIGAGVTINDYTFEDQARIVKANDRLQPLPIDESIAKSKLNTVAIHIPLLFEFSPARDFFLSAGCFADLIVGSHLKSKFPKRKINNAYTNLGQFGVTARVGYRDTYFFANYGFADLINYEYGPALRPWSFGVGLKF
jgi:hypothetical protein